MTRRKLFAMFAAVIGWRGRDWIRTIRVHSRYSPDGYVSLKKGAIGHAQLRGSWMVFNFTEPQ